MKSCPGGLRLAVILEFHISHHVTPTCMFSLSGRQVMVNANTFSFAESPYLEHH
jgi:hypothetical protein